MEINIFEETKKMYKREIEKLKEQLEEERKRKYYYLKLLHKKKENKKIMIEENFYGNFNITINDTEYVDVPSTKPKKIIVADSGKYYSAGQYYIILGFEWTEIEKEYVEIDSEYDEREFRFADTETLFQFLNVYLNRFEWENGKQYNSSRYN